jgi:hypothetical protein
MGVACRDCVKSWPSPPPAFYRCNDSRVGKFDLVFGKQDPPCREVRENETLCGPDGRWFQPEPDCSFRGMVLSLFSRWGAR